jgi:hypothetical protein
MADNLPSSSADVTESGSLNLPEPHRPLTGLLYFFFLHILQCMLERTDAITNEVLEPSTFVLATVEQKYFSYIDLVELHVST